MLTHIGHKEDTYERAQAAMNLSSLNQIVLIPESRRPVRRVTQTSD
jgi:hypothetical protein